MSMQTIGKQMVTTAHEVVFCRNPREVTSACRPFKWEYTHFFNTPLSKIIGIIADGINMILMVFPASGSVMESSGRNEVE
ncbi:hypothetical protein EVAR_61557_1 [Eumeta japonica]|uniref:Uncharacterized protein n=1 Tax=Eumeta variegata TaxID=151549 RepID=A0A4C1Z9F5_EUMVA|nr:hypothetical protein EVAR_61557_1 [Eumeta japonica]